MLGGGQFGARQVAQPLRRQRERGGAHWHGRASWIARAGARGIGGDWVLHADIVAGRPRLVSSDVGFSQAAVARKVTSPAVVVGT